MLLLFLCWGCVAVGCVSCISSYEITATISLLSSKTDVVTGRRRVVPYHYNGSQKQLRLDSRQLRGSITNINIFAASSHLFLLSGFKLLWVLSLLRSLLLLLLLLLLSEPYRLCLCCWFFRRDGIFFSIESHSEMVPIGIGFWVLILRINKLEGQARKIWCERCARIFFKSVPMKRH